MVTLTGSRRGGQTTDPNHARTRRWPNPAVVAGALAGAWVLPVLAQALKIEWLMLVLVWLGIGSLLQTGRILLDRLMFAAIILAGYLIVAGLVFSVWPWGLEPMPIAGVSLTLLVLVSVATGRRPQLPTKVVPSDLLVLAPGAIAWYFLHGPTAGKSFIQNLPYTAAREDMFNHYTLYDTIHRIGGYPFLKANATKPFMSDTVMDPTALRYYPSGSHYLDAILDIFWRSSTNPGSSISEWNRFVIYSILNIVVLAVVVVWAARWVGGPGLAGWRRGFICAVVGGFAAVGQLTTLYWQGFNAQAAGLIVLAFAFAIAVRPPRQVREQVVLLSTVVITATFVYDLTALMVLGMAAISVLVYWRRLLRHWRFVLAVGVPAIGLALIPYIAPMLAGFSPSGKFLAWGTSVRFSRTLSVVFVLVGLTAMLTRNGRRSPVWRASALSVAFCAGFTVCMGYYAYTQMGVTNYYYEKLVEGTWVVSLVGFGAVGMLLKPGPGLEAVGRRAQLAVKAGTIVLTGAIAAVMAGLIPLTSVRFPGWVPKQDVTWASVWKAGYISSGFAGPIQKAAEHKLIGDNKPTLIIFSDSGHDNRSASMFVCALNHDRGLIGDTQLDMLAGSDGLATLKLPMKGHPFSADASYSLDNLTNLINRSSVPVRIVLWNRDVGDWLKAYSRTHPSLGLDVVQLSE